MSLATVFWEDDPATKRKVVRYCRVCKVTDKAEFDIVSPQGTAHYAADRWDGGWTQCGRDATGKNWWWRT